MKKDWWALSETVIPLVWRGWVDTDTQLKWIDISLFFSQSKKWWPFLMLVHSRERLPLNKIFAASRMTLTYTGLLYLCRAVQYCLRVCAAVLIWARWQDEVTEICWLEHCPSVESLILENTLVWALLSALINRTLYNYLLLNLLNGSILCSSFKQTFPKGEKWGWIKQLWILWFWKQKKYCQTTLSSRTSSY